jgi:glutamate synthase domain-containing protein 2/glutamate synthase domain-containing protein 1/glutamate synthase domain-containing protein 3
VPTSRDRISDPSTLAWPHERDACGVGFIADLHGRPGRRVIEHALEALTNLAHRGAVSADGRTGDGAGILTQLPYRLLRRELARDGVHGVEDEELGVGMFFVTNDGPWERMYEIIEETIHASELRLLAWRDPPADDGALGDLALARRPVLKQAILGRPAGLDALAYERLLYLTRKRIERALADAGLGRAYVPSFSSRTVVYKGLMVADQLAAFYRDLADPDYETSLAVFHQRYSTNTMPRWSLAQPFRMLAHNGEINTLQGNVNLMAAREPVLESRVWGGDVRDLLPIVPPGASDSAALDNVLEVLALSGRDPLHALAMLVPPAFEGDDAMDPDVRAFFRYHASVMEPWDGPAALAVSDGRRAIAALDRNGLRPQRYKTTESGLVIVGSEAGMVRLPSDAIVERGRLGPGEMLAVDTQEGRLLHDAELKRELAGAYPYRAWLDANLLRPPAFDPAPSTAPDGDARVRLQTAMGYSSEDLDRIFAPMAFDAAIPVGSMGDDTPLAILSEQPQQLWRFFKQRFAQVTNPPIDPYRERTVMSLETTVGPRGPLLDDTERSAAVMRFPGPIIDEAQLAWILDQERFRTARIDTRFAVAGGPEAMASALQRIEDEAAAAVEGGAGLVLLSDRGVDAEHAAVPILLATGAAHHRLIRDGLRTRSALVLETAEPREDHHYACLVGYGAALIHPYLALATCRDVPDQVRRDDPLGPEAAVRNYVAAVEQGLLKIMSKMGISTISSYRAAQIFEAVGLDEGLVQRCFKGTAAHLGGAGVEQIADDVLRLHAAGYGEHGALVDRGIYRFRKRGEYHAFNPQVFKALHKAVREEDSEAYDRYAELVDGRPPTALRDLLEVRPLGPEVPVDEVEPIERIVRRFTTQAMSHGSVSRETHETLAIAMNRLHGKSNSGEGGEDPERYRPYERDREDRSVAPWHPEAGDWANSAIKQVASGRFGVTAHYLSTAREIEIKMAQGSKPGEGGQIPGFKVSEEIGRIRHSVPGVTLISPPPHHDIYSIEDLAQLIHDLKRVQKDARVGVKLVATHGVGTIAAGVAKGYADGIQISGFDGGTGASPLTSIKNAGVPWELGLADTQQALVENDLRGRVTLRVDGGLKTGRDVLVGALLGAEEYGFGTAALVSAGCAMLRQCHLNTCAVGVATQREDLRARYAGRPEHVVRFLSYVAQQVRLLLARMGARSLDEVVGRVDLLAPKDLELPRGVRLDLSTMLRDPDPSGERARCRRDARNDRPDGEPLDDRVWRDVWTDLEEFGRSDRGYLSSNRDRVVGARLAGEIARTHGAGGLPEGTVQLRFEGPVGQSFGAFLVPGMRLDLRGEGQDYVGKGMSGGEIALRALRAQIEPTVPVLLGNTVLYGATGGRLFAAGAAGERLAVRNSGAHAVVEGCGDHGCEYMTGGAVVVLGRTGRNFGAGMSGGVAFVLDESGDFDGRYNPGMVVAKRLAGGADEELLRALIARHHEATDSPRAAELLARWPQVRGAFWRVAPHSLPGHDDARDPGLWFAERALEGLAPAAATVRA